MYKFKIMTLKNLRHILFNRMFSNYLHFKNSVFMFVSETATMLKKNVADFDYPNPSFRFSAF